ncbi:MAG: hypothetical protein P8X96_09410 [Desulfobacteraceae bacterium]
MTDSKQKSGSLAIDLLIGFDFYLAFVKSTQLIYDTLWELGYDLDNEIQDGRGFTILEKINAVTEELSGAYQDIVDFAKRPPKDFSEWDKVLGFCVELLYAGDRIYEILKQEGIDPDGEFGKDFFKNLFKLPALKLLEFILPQFYHALVLATVIRPAAEGSPTAFLRDENGRIIRFPHTRTEVDPGRIKEVFKDPAKLFKEEYLTEPPDTALAGPGGLADPGLRQISDKFFKRLRKFVSSTGANAVYGLKPADWLDFQDPLTREINERTLSFWYEFLDEKLEIGASLAFSRSEDGRIGLAVVPFGGFEGDVKAGEWTAHIGATQFLSPFVLNGGGEDRNGAVTRLEVALSRGAKDESAAYVIGGTEGTRLELGRLSIEGGLGFSDQIDEIGFLLSCADSKLVLEAGDGDGFLKKVLPKKGAAIDFDLGLGWSNAFGFYIKGGTGLEVEFPKHKTIGKIFTLSALQLGINASNADLRLYASFSGGLDIGPFSAKIDNVGMQALWKFPEPQVEAPENGRFDFTFKPPKGVGIKIKAKEVKGGGYLYFDHEKHQYAGVAELSIKGAVTLKAVGIITTQMPDGSDGYSFMLLVTAEFDPKPIGLGFTLNGVGGLVGLNRTMDVTAIQLGVRDRTLDDILFPEKPLENAKRIIASTTKVFPPMDNQHVIGLMGLIAWGANSVVTFEVGLLIEFPQPEGLEIPKPSRLALVGVVKAAISKKVGGREKSVLKLQANFAGIIDFDRQFLSFDASLFDSTLLSFRFEGSLALRVQWGDQRCFLLSVGGFHPDFNDIPQGFPPMTRIMFPLADRKNFQLIFTLYLAITPNTFQIGAGVSFFIKISKFNLRGSFSFDALFYSRSNFRTRVTMDLEVRWGSRTLAGVSFKGTLTGTSPWNITGKAKIELLFWSKTFDVDKTTGEKIDTRLAAIDLLPELKEELQDERNWQEVTPSSTRSLVTAKAEGLPGGQRTLFIHPTGGLAINQTVLPLGIRLDKFGAQKIAGSDRFELQLADGDDRLLSTTAEKDLFAPAMYLELSEEQKLSRKSYERFPAGIKMQQADAVRLGSFREKTIEYEQKIYHGADKPVEAGLRTESATHFTIWGRRSAVGQSELGSTVINAPPDPATAVSLRDERYVVVFGSDLSPYADAAFCDSQTEALQLLDDIVEEHPGLEKRLTVMAERELTP